jgi:hypothetical protein
VRKVSGFLGLQEEYMKKTMEILLRREKVSRLQDENFSDGYER